MNEARLAHLLIEEVPQKTDAIDKKVGVLATRMLLQIQSIPSLLSHLADFAVVPIAGSADGNVKIQFDFLRLPKEILPDLERFLSVGYFKKSRLLQYTKNGQARTGLEIEVKPSDIPGDTYNYSY